MFESLLQKIAKNVSREYDRYLLKIIDEAPDGKIVCVHDHAFCTETDPIDNTFKAYQVVEAHYIHKAEICDEKVTKYTFDRVIMFGKES